MWSTLIKPALPAAVITAGLTVGLFKGLAYLAEKTAKAVAPALPK